MTSPDTSAVPDRKRVKRRQYVALAAIIATTLGFAGWALWSSFQPKGDVRRHREEKPVGHRIEMPAPAEPRDVWIAKSEEDLLKLKQDRKELDDSLRELRAELEGLKEEQKSSDPRGAGRGAIPARPPLPPLPPAPAMPESGGARALTAAPAGAPGSAPATLPPPPGGPTPPTGIKGGKEAGIAEITIPLPEPPKTDSSDRHVDNYIPAGSLGRAILLTGLDAPTGGAAQNNPVPFVVKLKDHGRLPNGFRSRVKDCHVVLAGFGDISAERVYARTETLSCVLLDGRIVETSLKGHVSGEDGKTGMRGRVVSKQGALIARSLLAGVAGGIGDGISQSFQTVTATPLGTVSAIDPKKIAQQGLAEGFGTALDRISSWYLERADETYPIIEVDAARLVDIVLTQGTRLGEEGLGDGRADAGQPETHPWQK